MNLFACKLLVDENIHSLVLEFLRQKGCDIKDVVSLGFGGAADDLILGEAAKNGRIVLTHDRDFGRLAVLGQHPLNGIVYLRPGHIDPQFTIDTLLAINAEELDLSPSFILVARRRSTHVQLRMRRW